MHRLRDQREAHLALHASQQELVQVPHVAPGDLAAVRVLRHDHDCAQLDHAHHEGAHATRSSRRRLFAAHIKLLSFLSHKSLRIVTLT